MSATTSARRERIVGVHEYGANEAPTAGAGRLWTLARYVCGLKRKGWEAEEELASVEPEETIENDRIVACKVTQRTVE